MARKGERDLAKEQYWRNTLADWQKSGMRGPAYCSQQGLAYPLFGKWKQIIKRRDAELAVQTTSAGRSKRSNAGRRKKARKPAWKLQSTKSKICFIILFNKYIIFGGLNWVQIWI